MSALKADFIENLILICKILGVILLLRAAFLLAGYSGHVPIIDDLVFILVDFMREIGDHGLSVIGY